MRNNSDDIIQYLYFFICTVNTSRTNCFVYSSKWKIAENLKNTEQMYKMLCTRDAVEILSFIRSSKFKKELY